MPNYPSSGTLLLCSCCVTIGRLSAAGPRQGRGPAIPESPIRLPQLPESYLGAPVFGSIRMLADLVLSATLVATSSTESGRAEDGPGGM